MKQKFAWFVGFTVFGGHEYRFDAYIWTTIVQSCFLFFEQRLKNSAENWLCFIKNQFHGWSCPINLFSQIKTNSFWPCYYYKLVVINAHSDYHNDLKTVNVLVILLS